MNLKLLLPARIEYQGYVVRLSARGGEGSFTILPNHIDFVTILEPGLLYFTEKDGGEIFYAVDEGVLVKRGGEVFVSTRNAFRGPELGQLERIIQEEFQEIDEHERRARAALVELEVEVIRRYIELGEERYG